jgi:hypothetical protein
MNESVIPALAASILLLAGCHKAAPVQIGDAPSQVTEWGVVEVAACTPKHLQLNGKDCTLTATPLADGNFAVFIEGDFGVTDKNSPAGVPPGTKVHTTQNMIVRGNVECLCSFANKPVRFILRLKPS